MVARQLLCFACCSGAVLLHAAVDHYAAICERFPELGLSPTASPAVTVVASPTELQSAITTATSTPCLRGASIQEDEVVACVLDLIGI